MIKLPKGRTEIFLTYAALINLACTGTGLFLVLKEKPVPAFVQVVFAATFSPILYTLKPKIIE